MICWGRKREGGDGINAWTLPQLCQPGLVQVNPYVISASGGAAYFRQSHWSQFNTCQPRCPSIHFARASPSFLSPTKRDLDPQDLRMDARKEERRYKSIWIDHWWMRDVVSPPPTTTCQLVCLSKCLLPITVTLLPSSDPV